MAGIEDTLRQIVERLDKTERAVRKLAIYAQPAAGGADTFLALTDTPASYAGQAGKFTQVNAGATALEFDVVNWSDIANKPATFPPDTHTHDDRYYTETELATSGLASVHWDNITNEPASWTPSAHAASHQHGGSDEVATATAAANAIPKAGAGGKLDVGWLPTGSGNGLDADTVDGSHAAAFAAASHTHDDRYYTETELNTSGAGGQVHWNNIISKPSTFTPSTHATSHQHGGSDEVATETPAAYAIPKAGAGGKLAASWVDLGTIDHGSLGGLSDDDHVQYYNQARGDARYSQLGHNHSGVYSPIDHGHTDYQQIGWLQDFYGLSVGVVDDGGIGVPIVRAYDDSGLSLQDNGGNLGVFIKDGGNVGIGNGATTPAAPFEVNRTDDITGGILAIYQGKRQGANLNVEYYHTGDYSTANQMVLGLAANTNNGGANHKRTAVEFNASFDALTDASRNSLLQIRTAIAGTFGAALTMTGKTLGLFDAAASPQGMWHIHNSTGGGLLVTKTGVAASPITVIPNGTGDVGKLAYVQVLWWNGSAGQSGSATLTPGGASLSTTVGSDTYRTRINADGSMDVTRTAGSNAGTVLLWCVWLS